MGGNADSEGDTGTHASPPAVLLASQMEQSWGGRSSNGNCATLCRGAHLECVLESSGVLITPFYVLWCEWACGAWNQPATISSTTHALSLLTCIKTRGVAGAAVPAFSLFPLCLPTPLGPCRGEKQRWQIVPPNMEIATEHVRQTFLPDIPTPECTLTNNPQ